MTEHLPPTEVIEESQTLWQTQHLPAGCPHCQRVYLVPNLADGTHCPLCRQAVLEPQPVRSREAAPEKMLPLAINKSQLQSIYADFVSGVWIKPDEFKPEILLERAELAFWPLWLVDSDISGHWQMEAGFDYQVESTKEIYSNGQWQSRKQIETRIRWEQRTGKISTHVDNVPVPALQEHQNRLRMTGQYQLDKAKPFTPNDLSNGILELPDLPPEDAWPLARPQVDKTAAEICKQAAGAQHLRNFAMEAAYENLNWTEFLLPILTTFYRDDDGQPQIVVVNGETGAIQGPQLASQKRGYKISGIIAGVTGLFLLLALISLVLTAIFPPAGIIAGLLVFLGLSTGIAAIIPAVWPGQWNRKQANGPTMDKQ